MDREQKALTLSRFDQLLDDFEECAIEAGHCGAKGFGNTHAEATASMNQVRERIMVKLRELIAA